MTTPIIPDFIFSLYQQEVVGIVQRVIDSISTHFKIDESKLKRVVEKEVGLSLELIDDTKEKIRIIKCKPRPLLESQERCSARIKITDGTFVQCKLRFVNDSCYCKHHSKKPSKYGDIHDAQKDTSAQDVIIRRIPKIY